MLSVVVLDGGRSRSLGGDGVREESGQVGEWARMNLTQILLLSFPVSSHLVTIQPGPMLSDALASSPILRAEDGTALAPVGTGFEFGIDPSEDPELAMVSCPQQGRERVRSNSTQEVVGMD